MMTTDGFRTTGLGLLAAGALLLSACGGSETAAGSGDEIASLDDGGDERGDRDLADQPDETDADASADAQAAALEFSACLRDEGLDVPDVVVDAEGNLQLREVLQDLDPQDGSFREAMESCAELLDGVGFGGGRRAAIADDPEIADAFLEFSDCIRGQGFEDVPDLTLPAPGEGGGPGAGEGAPGRGQGDREGGFGDRNARFAEQLGLDAEDPDVAAALDTCAPVIDQAFADAGIGGPAESDR